jgi:hypothetical protein
VLTLAADVQFIKTRRKYFFTSGSWNLETTGIASLCSAIP